MQLAPVPVRSRDTAAANQNFAILGQLDFAARQNFPDRAFAQAKGMIDADERSRFSQPVALDHCITHASPESFRLAVERSATADERPELPTKLAVNPAQGPPAAQEMFARSSTKSLAEFLEFAFEFEVAFNPVFQ